MKKIMALFFVGLLMCSLFGCSQKNNSNLQNIESLTSEQAKNKLEKDNNIPFNAQNFFALIKANDIQKIKLFLKAGFDANTRDMDETDKTFYGKTPLMISAGLGYKDIVQTLIKQGANVNVLDNEGKSILWTVVDMDKPDMIKLLADNKVNLEYVETKENVNILFHAVANNKKDCVKELLNAGANPKVTHDSETILHEAVFHDVDQSTYKMLVDNGADINAKDNSGWTPLMIAVMEKHSIAVKALVDLGADASITNNEGKSALSMAQLFGYSDIVNILNSKK